MTKMKYQKIILISALIAVGINPLHAESSQDSPNLGHAVSPEEIAQWDISVFPDGEGLPDGEGNVVEGEKVYQQKCIACHGKNGLGTNVGDQLAGATMGLTTDYPEKTIGTYWPYATTVFDVVRRSMPMTAPGSLTDNETYAVTAYLLYLNNIIAKDDVMNKTSLPKVKMPNEDGFINIYEEEKSKND
jgi:cytochrome c